MSLIKVSVTVKSYPSRHTTSYRRSNDAVCLLGYSFQVSLNDSKTTSQIYIDKPFQKKEIEWKCIYLMPCRPTIDTKLLIF